jgi:ubiquinone/menaquinone biosynthesis C-methylase UbiE
VLQACAEQLPVKTESLDGLICKGVIPYTDESLALRELSRVLKAEGVAHCCYFGAGYYLRYLLCSPSWKLRFYGLRTLINTWLCSLTGLTLPGFIGDTVYQSHRRLAQHYREGDLRLLKENHAKTFLGFPVFIYHTVQKAIH